MAKQLLGGRPNKAALLRIKLATVVVSIVAFSGSLGAVAYIHPGVHGTTDTTSQAGTAGAVASADSSISQISSASLQLPTSQRQASLVPLVRTRGS